MGIYDPIESVRRLRQGIVAAIKGNTFLFDDSMCPLIVTMTGVPGVGAQSRITALQNYLSDTLSARPLVNFIRPACVRVGFVFPEAGDDFISEIQDVVRSPRFRALCQDLGIVQVVSGSVHFSVPEKDFRQDYVYPSHNPTLG